MLVDCAHVHAYVSVAEKVYGYMRVRTDLIVALEAHTYTKTHIYTHIYARIESCSLHDISSLWLT